MIELSSKVAVFLLGYEPKIPEHNPLKHLASLTLAPWKWVKISDTLLDRNQWSPFRDQKLIALTTHKVAMTPAGMQEVGLGPNVTHVWLEQQMQNPDFTNKVSQFLSRKLPISEITDRVTDHLHDWVENLLEKDPLARYQQGNPSTAQACGWAVRRTRDFLQAEGKDAHCRALYGSRTQTDMIKGCPKDTPEPGKVTYLSTEAQGPYQLEFWGEDGRQVQEHADNLKDLRKIAAQKHGMAVAVLSTRMLTDRQYQDSVIIREYLESGYTATKAQQHIEAAYKVIHDWYHTPSM